MAKSQDAKKNVKKEAKMSAKEKKQAKREKKAQKQKFLYLYNNQNSSYHLKAQAFSLCFLVILIRSDCFIFKKIFNLVTNN